MRGRNTLIALFLASTLYVQVYARLVHTFDKKVVLERKKTKTIYNPQNEMFVSCETKCLKK